MTVFKNNPLLMTVMGANPGARRKRPVDDPVDRKRPVDDPVDRAIGQIWPRLMSGVQVPIMDIQRIFRDIKLEVAGGLDLEAAVMRVGQRYQVNRNGSGRGSYRRNPSLGASLAGGMAGAFVTHALSNPATRVMKWELYDAFPSKQHAIALAIQLEEASPFSRPVKAQVKDRGPGAGRLRYEVWLRMGSGTKLNPRRSGHMAVKANPNPGNGKRKITMTIEKFAQWVKAKRDPAMWKAFIAKFKGYEKWTHGAKSRKVTLEWQNVPGMSGLWIMYDGGKQPESTYIMPGGSPRKGAWKHPWDTMPDIRHDAEAGIVVTKLRGKSKISDFYHR